jgi:inward rectifier potassium channel
MAQELQTNRDDIDRDLGLGSRVAQESHTRFLNRDGSFNVERRGLSYFRSQNLYHTLLTIPWLKFFGIVIAGYFVVNTLFAMAYMMIGPDALHGAESATAGEQFLDDFFFSVQTLATIGYGRMSPDGLAANILVTIEALVGLLGFALATGLLFARFSRPSARIVFSHNAIIAPYKAGTAFEFRIANERSNQLIEVEATVVLSRIEMEHGKPVRKFTPLPLERQKVMFFPLHWVIVHPIDDMSPLHGVSEEMLTSSDAEFLILLTGIDETFAQSVHARSSYKHDEVLWGRKFVDLYLPQGQGKIGINMKRIHDTEPAAH